MNAKQIAGYFQQRSPELPQIPETTINAKDYNSLQESLDVCSQKGGGHVIVPSGTWKTGALHFHSQTDLHLEEGAEVLFSDIPEDYLPVVRTRWEGFECMNYSPLLYAEECHDISITGKGILAGHGEAWWDWKKTQLPGTIRLYESVLKNVPVEERRFGTREDALRPSFIQPFHCERFLMDGITVVNGPQWTIHPVYCTNVTVRNCTIHTEGPNTDGLNPDSCSDVLVEHCSFSTGDDCIAINAGMNEDGWRVGIPCKNIEIRDCVMDDGHAGIAIGSGISGGAENIFVHNCSIRHTLTGVRIKSMRGRGGYVRNVFYRDLTLNDVENEAIQVTQYYDFTTIEPASQTPSAFDDIYFDSVSGSGASTAVLLRGLPELPINHIEMQDCSLTADSTLELSDVLNVSLNNVHLTASKSEK